MRVGRRTTDLPRPACAARALVPERPLTPGASHPHFLLRRGGDERTSGLGPGVQPTLQTRHLRETLSLQLEHSTGARMFGGSGAVGDDQFILGQLAGARADIGERNRDRALGVARVLRILGADVDQHGLALGKRLEGLGRRDPALLLRAETTLAPLLLCLSTMPAPT
jgi:hypothetical protein